MKSLSTRGQLFVVHHPQPLPFVGGGPLFAATGITNIAANITANASIEIAFRFICSPPPKIVEANESYLSFNAIYNLDETGGENLQAHYRCFEYQL